MSSSRREQVLLTLQLHGWVPTGGGAAIASKDYATAVGTKVAHAYLSESAAGDPNQTLYGDYYSEGRNIMPWVLIPKAADAEAVGLQVLDFAHGADRAVADSYAGRLAIRPGS